jgi:hypothetical protein
LSARRRGTGFVRGWRRAGERHGTSWPSGLQQGLELVRIAALDEEAVWIVALGQRDPASGYASFKETS